MYTNSMLSCMCTMHVFFNKFTVSNAQVQGDPVWSVQRMSFYDDGSNLYLVELDTIYCSKSKDHLHGEHSEFAPSWYVLTFTL